LIITDDADALDSTMSEGGFKVTGDMLVERSVLLNLVRPVREPSGFVPKIAVPADFIGR
jgi:hypothetical protein